jgi:hypothetical protein
MSATGELLEAAKALLMKGKSEKHEATTSDDVPTDPLDDDAAKFSVYGALLRAAHDIGNSNGFDTALVLLGVDNLQDARLAGWSKSLDDEELGKRFDAAIERANGGPVKARSIDVERKELDPNAEDFAEKNKALNEDPDALKQDQK